MMKLIWVSSCIALISGLLWVDVYYLGDKEVFVPSPDEVATSFFGFIQSEHYSQARHLLSKNLQQKTSAEDLKKFKKSLESKWGRIEKTMDEKSEYRLPQALAIVRLKTERGNFQLQLPAVRESGLWRISGLQ